MDHFAMNYLLYSSTIWRGCYSVPSRKFAPQKSLGKVQQQKGSETGVTIIPTKNEAFKKWANLTPKLGTVWVSELWFNSVKSFSLRRTIELGFVHSLKLWKVSRILHVSQLQSYFGIFWAKLRCFKSKQTAENEFLATF